MPLGIITEQEFESELSNCSVKSISNPTSSSITPRDSSVNPINSDSNLIDPSELITEETTPKQAIISSSEARGRGLSNTQVPSGIRKIIGETSAINGRADALELASLFDISPSSVSAYKKGAHSTSTINEPNKDTKLHIDSAKLRVSNRARKKLNLALSHITDEKLAGAKAVELASVAKAMSSIVVEMEPDSSDNKNNKLQTPFVVFAPILRREDQFEVVHAKDDY